MSSGIRMRGVVIAAVLALTAGGALAGCTGSDPAPTKSPRPSASASASTAPAYVDTTDTPGSGEGLVGAVADAKVTSCDPKGENWQVAGTLENPTDAAADYRIYVSLLNRANVTRGLKQVDVDGVAAGATAKWDADIPLTDANLTCVLRVERYAA